MRENITNGSIPFREAYIRTVVERIEVGPNVVRIVGAKRAVARALRDPAILSPGVR
jgi:hypothetical protein